jgi:hypothetical protein
MTEVLMILELELRYRSGLNFLKICVQQTIEFNEKVKVPIAKNACSQTIFNFFEIV